MRRSRQIAVLSGALLCVVGVILWQQAGVGAAPDNPDHPDNDEPSVASKPMRESDPDGSTESPGADDRRELLAESQGDDKPAATATGSLLLKVIYGDDRTPAADRGVVIYQLEHNNHLPPLRVRTDAEGKVRVADLMPGKLYFEIDLRHQIRDLATIKAGEETEYVINLTEGLDVAGVVVDRDDVAVAGATILVCDFSGNRALVMGHADAQGRFRIRQVGKNACVGARAEGHAPSAMYDLEAPVVAGAAGTGAIKLRIVLPGPGGGLQGQVLDPGGKAVAQAVVKLGKNRSGNVIRIPGGSRGRHPSVAQARTDDEGRFHFFGVEPGAIPISVDAPLLVPWSGKATIVAQVVQSMTIRLQPGVTCLGTVSDEEGQPAARVVVQGTGRVTRTAADGSYRLEGLTPGSITFYANHHDDGKDRIVLQGRAGETLRWDARLSRGLVLRGQVLDQADKPVPQVMVKARGPKKKGARWPWSGDALTDAHGRFSLLNCPQGGLLQLVLRKPDYKTVRRGDVDPAAQSRLVIRMPVLGGTGRITGIVLDPDGQPIGNASVSLARMSDTLARRMYRTAAKTGRFDVGQLSPDVYLLSIRAGAYPPYVAPDRAVGPGETWDLGSVQLVRGGRVRVQVDDTRKDKRTPAYLGFWNLSGSRYVGGVNRREKPLRSVPLFQVATTSTSGGRRWCHPTCRSRCVRVRRAVFGSRPGPVSRRSSSCRHRQTPAAS